MRHTLWSLILLAACAPTEHADESAAAAALIDDTPEAVGLLAMLNDPSTTLFVLDEQVPLDRRAADGLVAHRDGPDGRWGTTDDDRFDSVGEVDDVPYVGPVALARLVAYAEAGGFIPGDDDLLGVYDGVPFTVAEARRALRIANEESTGVLRVEVGLDSRAVDSIVNARPVATVAELASLYWVGRAMLERLKDYTAPPTGPIDCRADFECPDGLRCIGKPFDGSSERGICRDLSPIAGEGAVCDDATPCDDGLFCSGLTLWDSGECRPDWMADTFTNTVQRHIPRETTTPVATGVIVRGQASVPVDLVVSVDLGHDDPHALRIGLRDPNGAEAILWDGPNEGGRPFPDALIADGGISRDDTINGWWMLRIWNVDHGDPGTLRGWTLYATSRWD